MKPSDIASKIANRNQRDAKQHPVTSTTPEHQAQIDQAWEAIRPKQPTEN